MEDMQNSNIPPVCIKCCGVYTKLVCVCIQDQYAFIHDAILEAVTCGDTQIESSNLRAKLNKIWKKNQSGKTELELQFTVSQL